MNPVDKANDVVTLGKSQFRLSYLKSVTIKEAIEHYKRMCHEDRIRNAWKRANNKK